LFVSYVSHINIRSPGRSFLTIFEHLRFVFLLMLLFASTYSLTFPNLW